MLGCPNFCHHRDVHRLVELHRVGSESVTGKVRVSDRVRRLTFSAWRWMVVVPEVGDTRGWLVLVFVRIPVVSVYLSVVVLATFMAVPLGLGALRLGSRLLIVVGVANAGGIMAAWAYNGLEWRRRAQALADGATPYGVVRISARWVAVRIPGRRCEIPWDKVVRAAASDTGFELTWGSAGSVSGFRVSPTQSSLLPSGEMPDDASMAAWINERRALHGSAAVPCGH